MLSLLFVVSIVCLTISFLSLKTQVDIADSQKSIQPFVLPETEKEETKEVYYFDLVGTELGNRDELIQRTVKNYLKDNSLWGTYEGLTSNEIKESLATKEEPIWEFSSFESFDVILVKEHNNKFEENAISVRLLTGETIGYISKNDFDKLDKISTRILSIEAQIRGGKYKYVDYNDFGDEKIVTDSIKYSLKICVTSSLKFSLNETYIDIKHDYSSSSIPEIKKAKTLTEIPNYTKARKYEDNYVVTDFETTGLSPETNEIIQIGAIKYENDIEIERFNQLIKPIRSEISDTITKITGINYEMVKDSPTFNEKYNDLLEFISGYTLVAHNAPFDMNFLLHQLAENTTEIPKFRVFNTLPPSRKKLDFLVDRKLVTIKKFLNLNTKSHDALEDCITTAHLYQYLKNH